MEIRLQKILADAGVASRRAAEHLIAAGRVAVNGSVVAKPGTKADPVRDTVTLDGKRILPKTEWLYLMLHKPEGVITASRDPQNRPIVLDYMPPEATSARVFPVGRLDYDSSGLLLLTNDGALAQALTHPRHAVEKTYMARLRGVPDAAALRTFANGISIDGKRTAPAKIKISRIRRGGKNNAETPKSKSTAGQSQIRNASVVQTATKLLPTPASVECDVQITIHEGRNRQIRKMCEAIGHPVLALKRVAVGKLYLGNLPRGACRFLTDAEVKYLLSLKESSHQS